MKIYKTIEYSKKSINEYIKEHIIRGDRGDGVPNILSPDNVFVTGGRQKVINTKRLKEWMISNPEDFCINDNMMRGYKRNQTLVDLDYTPEVIKEKIVETYETIKPNSKQKMFNYFIEHRLRNLMDVIHEF